MDSHIKTAASGAENNSIQIPNQENSINFVSSVSVIVVGKISQIYCLIKNFRALRFLQG